MNVEVKTIKNFVQAISGLFTSDLNPNGLTKVEIDLVSLILSEYPVQVLDREARIELANKMNLKLQVVVNYINKLKKKKVIGSNDRLHPAFRENEISIVWKG
jgi:DNA-binding MarR family transcriptional regulator